jgi:hypothetical protein
MDRLVCWEPLQPIRHALNLMKSASAKRRRAQKYLFWRWETSKRKRKHRETFIFLKGILKQFISEYWVCSILKYFLVSFNPVSLRRPEDAILWEYPARSQAGYYLNKSPLVNVSLVTYNFYGWKITNSSDLTFERQREKFLSLIFSTFLQLQRDISCITRKRLTVIMESSQRYVPIYYM